MPKTIFSRQQLELQKLLRKARIEARLTQIEVAVRLKQPQSFVSKYESGERMLDVVELRQVCEALGISLSEIIRRWEAALE